MERTGARVAIVHDALVNCGGAERSVVFMCEAFPDAPLFTSVYLPELTYADFARRRVTTLPGARWVRSERRAKQLLPLWILGFQRLDLAAFDVVISSTTFGAKHVRPRRNSPHVCYCYSPFRWLWKRDVYSVDSVPLGPILRRGARLGAFALKRLDARAMARAARIGTTCRGMAAEIAQCYGRVAEIVPPPISLADYALGTGTGDYYLCVSRLMSHKRIDLAVDACRRLGRHLVVVGDGPEIAALQQNCGDGTRFMGRVDNDTLRRLYAGCRAVIFPSHEDYGLVPLEANASGRPVVAYKAGGVLETMCEGETAVFFEEQTVESVVEAVERAERMSFDPERIRALADRFDVRHFIRSFRRFALET